MATTLRGQTCARRFGIGSHNHHRELRERRLQASPGVDDAVPCQVVVMTACSFDGSGPDCRAANQLAPAIGGCSPHLQWWSAVMQKLDA